MPYGAPIGATIADDVSDGYVVLFGGYGFASLPQSLTWAYTSNGWENLTADQTTSPPPCKFCEMTYDAGAQYVVLFDQGTWVFQAGRWSPASPVSSPPTTLVDEALAYDAVDHEDILFGGRYQVPGCNCQVDTDATWAYRSSNWVNITSSAGTSPSLRRWASMTYDPSDAELLLFGGWDDVTASLLADTWTFSGGHWTASSSSGPGYRALGQLVNDVTDGYVLLYGGTGCNSVNWICTDTWTFHAGSWSQVFPLVSPYVENGSQEVMVYDHETSYTILLEQWTSSGNFTTNESIPFSWPAPLRETVSPSTPSLDANQTLSLHAIGAGGVPPLSYTWSSGPPGCSASIGAYLNCTPTRSWSGPVSVTVTDASGRSAATSTQVQVYSDPVVSSPAPDLGAVDVGHPVSFSSSATGGVGPYVFTWSASAAMGCSVTTTGVEPCVPTAAGAYPIGVSVQDANGFTTPVSSITFDVYAGPTVTLAENQSHLDLGESVFFWANATGGTGVFSFTYNTLPTGCTSLNSSTLTCRPSIQGTYSVTVTVVDTGGGSATSSAVYFGVNPDPVFSSFWNSTSPVSNRTTYWLSFENGSGTYQVNLSSGTPTYDYCLETLPVTPYDRCSGWTGQVTFRFGVIFAQPFGILPGSYVFEFSAKDSTGWNHTIKVRIEVVWTPTLLPSALPGVVDQGMVSHFPFTVLHGAATYSFWANDTTTSTPLCAVQLTSGPGSASCAYVVSWLGTNTLNFTMRDSLGVQRSGAAVLTSMTSPTFSVLSSPSAAPLDVPFTVAGLAAYGASPYLFCTFVPSLGGGPRCLPSSLGNLATFSYRAPSVGRLMIGLSMNDSAGLNLTAWTNVSIVPDLSSAALGGPAWAYLGSNVLLNATFLGGVPNFNLWFNETNASILLCPRAVATQDTTVPCPFQPWWSGTARLEVTVRDVYGENTTANLTMTVYPAPTVDRATASTGSLVAATGGVLTAEVGGPVYLNATFSGGRGALEFGWWVSGTLIGEQNGTAGSWNLTWVPSTTGTDLALFVLRDGSGGVTSVSISISVRSALTAASIQASPATVDVGVHANVSVSFSNGVAPFYFLWASRAPSGSWSYWTTSVPWIYLNWTSTGTFVVSVSVHDADRSLSSSSENVTVLAAPVLPCAPTSSSTHWTAGSELNFTISCLSGGAAPLLFTWTWGDGLNSSVSATGASHAYAVPGHYNVTVEVQDAFSERALSLALEVDVLPAPAGRGGNGPSPNAGSALPLWEMALLGGLVVVALLSAVLAFTRRRGRRSPPRSSGPKDGKGGAEEDASEDPGDVHAGSQVDADAEQSPISEVSEADLRRSAEIDASLLEVMRGGRRAGLPEFREALAPYGLSDAVLLEHLFALKTSGKVYLLPEGQETDSPIFALAPMGGASLPPERAAAPQVDEAMLNDFLARRDSSLEMEVGAEPEGVTDGE